MGQMLIAPESRTEPFLELSRTKKGRLFKKHILSLGPLFANGKKYEVDENFMQQMVTNFHAKHCDIVQVPIVGKDNQHSEDPRDNIGEVVDLKFEGGKLYSYIDSRKEDASSELGNTLIGASAMISPNYVDTNTDTNVGPTLLHVAITNRPHVLNLGDFEEIIAASSEGSGEVIFLSEGPETSEVEKNELEETKVMTKEELLELLKAEHSVDVNELLGNIEALTTEKTEISEELTTVIAERDTLKTDAVTLEEVAVKLSNSIKDNLASDVLIKLSADADSASQVETLIAAVVDAGSTMSKQSTDIIGLSGRIESLEQDKKNTAAAAHVDSLVLSGHILPVNRDAMVELRLSNAEIFDKIIPETPLIELSQENGSSEEPNLDSAEFVKGEVARLSAIK